MDHSDLRIHIAKDFSEVRLVAHAGLNPAVVAASALRERLRGAGVEITAQVTAALDRFAAEYPKGTLEMVVAKATPSVKGADGRIEFEPTLDPTKVIDTHPHSAHAAVDAQGHATPHAPDRRDHYAGRAHLHVTEGARIGTLIQPTQGTPGRDVLGNPTACLGAPCPIRLDKSVRVNTDGSIVAVGAGVLNLANNLLSVSSVLDIPGTLDFTVGHVDVDGDVRIGNGIKPGFKVKATGLVTVRGLVEVGDITCKDLHIDGGIAGAGRGELHISGNAHFNYADGVRGVIGHSLSVSSELTNCHLVIGEDLKAPGATIFGGEIAVTGSLNAKALGSDAFRMTTLLLGEVPLLVRPRRELLAHIAAAESKMAALREEEKLLRGCSRQTASQRERLTEFAFDLSEAGHAHAAAVAKLAEVDAVIAQKRKVHVQVVRIIHPKVRLVVGDNVADITREIKGPVEILWDDSHNLMCRFGSGPVKPLTDYATVHKRTPDEHAADGHKHTGDAHKHGPDAHKHVGDAHKPAA